MFTCTAAQNMEAAECSEFSAAAVHDVGAASVGIVVGLKMRSNGSRRILGPPASGAAADQRDGRFACISCFFLRARHDFRSSPFARIEKKKRRLQTSRGTNVQEKKEKGEVKKKKTKLSHDKQKCITPTIKYKSLNGGIRL